MECLLILDRSTDQKSMEATAMLDATEAIMLRLPAKITSSFTANEVWYLEL